MRVTARKVIKRANDMTGESAVGSIRPLNFGAF